LKCFVEELSSRDILVGTTGMLSRELFEFRYFFYSFIHFKRYFKFLCILILNLKRKFKKQGHEKDFLTVGSMGHASAIALGIAMFKGKRNVNKL
jgi:phosphonopyruvate decarboxylase